MWILKNSTNLLSFLSHLGVHRATSIQTFDFSTLYTSIPHDLLKSRMNSIKYENGATRYTNIKVGRNKSYFTSDPLTLSCPEGGGGGLRGPDGQTHSCQSETSYLMMPKLGDF